MKTGDIVSRIAFTDCFGVDHPEIRGLTVVSVQHITPEMSDVPHWRAEAKADNGDRYEGAQRFFSLGYLQGDRIEEVEL